MLSRAAQSVYWMGRYLERADNVARSIYVNVHLLLDLGIDGAEAQWLPLVIASGDDDDFAERYDAPTETEVTRFLMHDEENPNSILSCIRKARENARTVREIISSEMWETLNDLYHFVQAETEITPQTLQSYCARIRELTHLFTGLAEETMSHGEGWHFLRLGRMLERADKTARLLDVKYFFLLPTPDYVDSPHDAVEWGAVLKSVGGFEMYRKLHHRINYQDVTRFLMLDADFPRSMRFAAECARASLNWITGGQGSDAARALGTVCAMVDAEAVAPILAGGLHEFIDRFQLALNAAGEAVYREFFALR